MINPNAKLLDKCTLSYLIMCFPKSFVNGNNEFIAHRKSNTYFRLEDCSTALDLQCKVIEWVSRPACKGIPYSSDWRNDKFQDEMRAGINKFLGTNFSREEMEDIHTYLGNSVNRQKTVAFIESGYDMNILPLKGKELEEYISAMQEQEIEIEDVSEAGSCSYENCLSCNVSTCSTGKVAREQGEDAYNDYIDMLVEAVEEELEL